MDDYKVEGDYKYANNYRVVTTNQSQDRQNMLSVICGESWKAHFYLNFMLTMLTRSVINAPQLNHPAQRTKPCHEHSMR